MLLVRATRGKHMSSYQTAFDNLYAKGSAGINSTLELKGLTVKSLISEDLGEVIFFVDSKNWGELYREPRGVHKGPTMGAQLGCA